MWTLGTFTRFLDEAIIALLCLSVCVCVSLSLCVCVCVCSRSCMSSSFCFVCHSGPCVDNVCCTLYGWMGTAWAWPAISPPTTHIHTQPGQLPPSVCVWVCVCVFMCVCVQGKYKSSIPFSSILLFVCVCVWVSPLLLVFPHPPQGTARTAAVPMTTSVLLSITMPASWSLAYVLYMWLLQLWQVCRWHVTQLYSPHQQMHGTLQPQWYKPIQDVSVWQCSCRLLSHLILIFVIRSTCPVCETLNG